MAAMAAKNTQDAVYDDFDYEQWAPTAKQRLMENGVWDIVGTGVPPDPTKIPEKAATITVVDLAQWRNRVIKNLKALKIIQSSLTESTFRNTISVSSAKDLWNLLEKGNEERKLRRLENDFDEFRMYEGESMGRYLDRVLDLNERFNVSANPKSDDDFIRKMLTSLPWPYDGDVLRVLEDLMNLPDMTLRDLIDIFDLFGSDSRPREYMLQQLKNFYKSLKKAKSEQLWCRVCKKYDHNQEDCKVTDQQARIDQQRNQKPNQERKLGRLENGYDEFRMRVGESMDRYMERLFDLMFRFNVSKDTKSDHVVVRTMLSSLHWSYDGDVVQVVEDLMALPDMTYSDLVDIFYMISLLPREHIVPQMKDFYKTVKKSKSEEYDHNQEDCQKPKHVMFTVTSGDFTYDEDMWMIYTASSDHMTPYEKLFTSLDRTYRAGVEMANGSVVMAEGKGDVMFVMKGVKMMIKNVLFVPGINRNVLSFGQMAKRGYSMEVAKGVCTLRDKTGKVFAKTLRDDERGYGLRLSVIEGNINSTL